MFRFECASMWPSTSSNTQANRPHRRHTGTVYMLHSCTACGCVVSSFLLFDSRVESVRENRTHMRRCDVYYSDVSLPTLLSNWNSQRLVVLFVVLYYTYYIICSFGAVHLYPRLHGFFLFCCGCLLGFHVSRAIETHSPTMIRLHHHRWFGIALCATHGNWLVPVGARACVLFGAVEAHTRPDQTHDFICPLDFSVFVCTKRICISIRYRCTRCVHGTQYSYAIYYVLGSMNNK